LFLINQLNQICYFMWNLFWKRLLERSMLFRTLVVSPLLITDRWMLKPCDEIFNIWLCYLVSCWIKFQLVIPFVFSIIYLYNIHWWSREVFYKYKILASFLF
jgi:hypothetical protein